ncbi:MAG: ribose-phosphate pyrophosphokinase [Candidatus Omnitrophota bacterium]|nr:ribose-phosphate pyrophosphokinase [Candidatus Omnitrophota bacterium]
MRDKLTVFSGNASKDLAEGIAKYLKLTLGRVNAGRFSDGEISIKIEENVREKDIFVIQSIYPPADNLMELLILIDALSRSSAQRITAVVPYYGYARQDRKDRPRVPITAKLVADLLSVAGADRVLTIDLHAGQIQGFFDIPVDNLYAVNILLEHFRNLNLDNLVVVSPDVGGIKMARAYSKRLSASLAIVDKRRINDRQAEVMNILGEVKGKNVIIVDDIVSTAGTITEAVRGLKNRGAKNIYCAVTHSVLSGPAIERIDKADINEFVVTDTIPAQGERSHPKIKVLSVAPLLGEAIKRIHNGESVSSLFT